MITRIRCRIAGQAVHQITHQRNHASAIGRVTLAFLAVLVGSSIAQEAPLSEHTSTAQENKAAQIAADRSKQRVDQLVAKCSTLFREAGLQAEIGSDQDGAYIQSPSFEKMFGDTDLALVRPMMGRGGETDWYARAFLLANIEFEIMKLVPDANKVPEAMQESLGVFYTHEGGQFVNLSGRKELPRATRRDLQALRNTEPLWQAFRELVITETRTADHGGQPHFFAREYSRSYPGNRATLLEHYRVVKRVWQQRKFADLIKATLP